MNSWPNRLHGPRSLAARLRAQAPEGLELSRSQRELRGNLIYRRFTRFNAEIISRIAAASADGLPCSFPRSPRRFINESWA